MSNLASLYDLLAGASGALSELTRHHPELENDPNYRLARRDLTHSISLLLSLERRYMTPKENKEIQEELFALRNGAR